MNKHLGNTLVSFKKATSFIIKFSTITMLSLLFGNYGWAQEHWKFDDRDAPLRSIPNGMRFEWHSKQNMPELAAGIIGTGLRTDGYSTWLSQKVNMQDSLSMSGWFALESFPTDTAAFFGFQGQPTSFAVCVDRFGEILVNMGKEGEFSYSSTGHYVKRFKWINIALSVKDNTLEIWVDAEKIDGGNRHFASPLQINEILVAKDIRQKRLGLQNLNVLNTLIDDIKLWEGSINLNNLHQEVIKHASNTPTLAIPKSRFENDFSRPKFHLLPAANWTNETHGLILYKDKYHIFNQKNASNLFLRQINWGHFSSPDLINWTEHIPALTPDRGYDENGIWSGHVVLDDNGVPTIIYTTGSDTMGVGLAFPKDDDLIEWQKYDKNPVIRGQPEGYSRTDLRDPYVWKEGGIWYLVIGYGIEENDANRGTVLLYTSKDLKKWEFKHTLFEGNPEKDDTGIFWEMPVFKKIGEKYVLLINKTPHNGVPARAMYWVGDFKNERFIPDNMQPRNLEIINRLLSPSVTEDKQGRITAIAIIPDEFGEAAAYKQGWTHLYSIPRVWNLKEGKIIQTPHPNLQTIRDKYVSFPEIKINNGDTYKLSQHTHQLEIKAKINVNGAKKFGFIVNKNPDGSEYTKIYYDVENQQMVVDQTYSSLKEHIPKQIKKEIYHLDLSNPIDFHVFIDGSVIEVFVNGEDAFTTRVFPKKVTSNEVEIFSENGEIVAKADVWTLKATTITVDF